MHKKALIHCVDDEPVNLAIMQELLQDRYDLTTADSGEGCLRQVETRPPDLILLDVNMPEIDGLETCRRLREDPETAEIPIIFLSALTTLDDLVAGYEAGGDDYITKPFSEEILQKKIELVLASQQRKQELKHMSDSAVAALMRNLGATEELRLLVGFLHRCQTAKTLDELAAAVFDCLAEFELDGSLLIPWEGGNRIWFSDGIDRPMEGQILQSLRGQDRVLVFGTRLAVNTEQATFLVRNLPADRELVESLRERLTVLAEGLDARVRALESKVLLDRRREVLSRVLEASRENIDRVEAYHRRQHEEAGKLLARMLTRLDAGLGDLEIDAERRDALLGQVGAIIGEIEVLCGQSPQQHDEFRAVLEELDRVLAE